MTEFYFVILLIIFLHEFYDQLINLGMFFFQMLIQQMSSFFKLLRKLRMILCDTVMDLYDDPRSVWQSFPHPYDI